MPLAIYILRTYHFPTPINATTQLDARSTAQSYCGMPPLRLRSKVRKLPNNSSSANTPIGRVKVCIAAVGWKRKHYSRSLPAPTRYSDRGLHPALAHDWRGLFSSKACINLHLSQHRRTGHLSSRRLRYEEAEQASELGLWIMKFWPKNYKR